MRVILIDDSPLFLDGIELCICRQPDVVVSYKGPPQAIGRRLSISRASEETITIIGPNVEETESFFIARRLVEMGCHVQVIMLADLDQDHLVQADATYIGTAACLTSEITCEELRAAICSVAAGYRLVGNSDYSWGLQPSPLTVAERRVLTQLADQKTYTEVAAILSIAVPTVRSHAQHILEKLQVHDRDAAVRRALRRGWLNN